MERRRPSFHGRRLLQASSLGLADQALMSAANFATIVVLARELAPADFGAFVLAYTALLLLNGLQTALVTQPHNVLGQTGHADDYADYTTSTAVGQLIFIVPFAGLALVAAAVTQIVAPGAAPALSLAFVPALVAWQLQEFGRRVLYTEGRLGAAFAADAVSYGGQVAALATLAAADRLSAPFALYAVAATSALGGVVAGWAIRGSLRGRVDISLAARNWSFGKWLGAAIAASWLAGHLYIYLAAVLIGPTASGALKAAQVILGPLNAFFLFLFTVLPIRFSGTRDRAGDVGVDADLRRAYLATSPLVVVYCALAAVFAGPVLDLLYGETYDAYANVVALFAVYYLVMHVVYLLTSALTARRMTRSLFKGSAYGGLVGVTLGWPLVVAWEAEGAVVGMIVSAVVITVAFWRAYRLAPPTAHGVDEVDVAAVPTRA